MTFTVCELEHGPVEIVDKNPFKMVMFYSYVNVYQRVVGSWANTPAHWLPLAAYETLAITWWMFALTLRFVPILGEMAHWVQASLTTWNQSHHCQSLSFDKIWCLSDESLCESDFVMNVHMVKSNFPTCSWENVGRKMVKQCDADSEIYTKRRIKIMSVIWRVP